MTISGGLGVVLGLITLASAVGTFVALARAGFKKTTIQTLQENNDALTARVDLLEKENTRQASSLAAVQAENAMLRSMVSGSEAIAALAKSIATSDLARQQEHHDMLATIQVLPTVVTKCHEEVMALIRHSSGAA